MEFLLYLTPHAKDILNQIYQAKYSVRENVGYCRSNTNIFGYADFNKKFVICTKNIKNSGFNPKFYINETVYHEGTHVGHLCNGYKPFGISLNGMPLPSNKLQDVRNSVKSSTASYRMEHEAYWMEDKPEKVKYVIQKYCL
jgi:hypothetical protein